MYRMQKAREVAGATVINIDDKDHVEQVRALTQGRGADVVIDAVGMEAHHGALDAVAKLLRLVAEGHVRLDDVMSHQLPLADAPRTYEIFNEEKDGCVKVVLKPRPHAAAERCARRANPARGGRPALTPGVARCHTPPARAARSPHRPGTASPGATGVSARDAAPVAVVRLPAPVRRLRGGAAPGQCFPPAEARCNPCHEVTMNRTAAPLLALALGLAPLAADAQVTVSGQVAVGTPVYANTAPPPPRAEPQPPAPGPGYTWVNGFWNWSGSQYVWTPGRWELPPQAAQAWEPAQWEREGGRYRFRPGRWGNRGQMGGPPPNVVVAQPPPNVVVAPPVPVAQPVGQPPSTVVVGAVPPPVVVPMAPPRPRFERRSRPAAPGQVWVPGAWSWNGSQHVWVAGHWDTPPRPRARWMQPQWRRQGRQWVVVPGYWR